ncbi:hypothetical protein JTB14_015155 [Gonioctena quinquepunctata]|nr:hypothetical protein JTB14_015155 [Gonioctena quinquepunctata]
MVASILQLLGYLVGGLVMCHYGQTLTDELSSIGEAVYASKWYLSEPKMVRDVKFILLRCQKPFELNAFLFGTFSFTTYMLVLKTSYSYYTILRQRI